MAKKKIHILDSDSIGKIKKEINDNSLVTLKIILKNDKFYTEYSTDYSDKNISIEVGDSMLELYTILDRLEDTIEAKKDCKEHYSDLIKNFYLYYDKTINKIILNEGVLNREEMEKINTEISALTKSYTVVKDINDLVKNSEIEDVDITLTKGKRKISLKLEEIIKQITVAIENNLNKK